MYDFLLMYTSSHIAISHRLSAIGTFSLSLIRPKFWTPTLTLTGGLFFSKSTHLFPVSEERLPAKIEVDWFNMFEVFC